MPRGWFICPIVTEQAETPIPADLTVTELVGAEWDSQRLQWIGGERITSPHPDAGKTISQTRRRPDVPASCGCLVAIAGPNRALVVVAGRLAVLNTWRQRPDVVLVGWCNTNMTLPAAIRQAVIDRARELGKPLNWTPDGFHVGDVS